MTNERNAAEARVRVAKPLFWRKSTDHPQDGEPGSWVADGISGRYTARKERDGSWLLWWAHDNFVWEKCATFAEVKEKAEADWQARFAKCLSDEPPAQTSRDAALEEAAHKLRMVVSHASGGHVDLDETPMSINDICVAISRHHNAVFAHGKEAALKSTPAAMTQAGEGEAWEGPAYEYGVTWGPESPPITPDVSALVEALTKGISEALSLIDEINERSSSRQFYGINQTLHAKLATIRATLALASIGKDR